MTFLGGIKELISMPVTVSFRMLALQVKHQRQIGSIKTLISQ